MMAHDRSDGPGPRARRAARCGAALLAAALFTGCASEHPAPYDCGVDPRSRPLGARTIPFLQWVASLPQRTVEEVDHRSSMLAEGLDRYADRVGDDASATATHARNFGRFTANDCSTHGADLTDFFESQGDRMREDTHCFWARTWQTLKLIE